MAVRRLVPVHDDLLLSEHDSSTFVPLRCADYVPFIEPPLRAEPGSGLRRTRRHKREREQPDQKRCDALDKEEVPPPRRAGDGAQPKNACREECADEMGHEVGDPKPRKPYGQLVLGVEVGKVEDDVWNEAALHESEETPKIPVR